MREPSDTPEVPFEAPWQARIFAAILDLHRAGRLAWPDWAAMLGRHIAAMPQRPYYDSWLAAAEEISLTLLECPQDAFTARVKIFAAEMSHDDHDHHDHHHAPAPVAVSPPHQ